MTAANPILRLSVDDLTVAVSGGDPSHQAWLREFLEPDFRVVAEKPADCTVHIVSDTSLYEEHVGAGPTSDMPLFDCFALDSSVVRLPVLERRGTTTTVFDDLFEAVYAIEPDRACVTIITRAGNVRVRASMLRVVREFAMNHLHPKGLFLHASAVAIGSTGIAFAGHKAAGKTTMLTYLLSCGIGAYLSNDRVYASELDGRLEFRNIPTVISVRPGTLDLCPGFRDRFWASGFASYLATLDEAAAAAETEIHKNQFGNYFLSPGQYRSILDARQQTRAQAVALLFPVVSGDLETFELRELSTAESLERLPQAFLGSGTWRKGTDAFRIPAIGPAPSDSTLDEQAQTLCEYVRCIELRLGPRAYVDAELATAVARLAGESKG